MPQALILLDRCTACGDLCRPGDRFCGHCGVSREASSIVAGPPVPPARAAALPPLRNCLEKRWVVIGLLFAIGPLGLVPLWLSRRFSPLTKTLISILYAVVTVLLPLVITWYWLHVAMRPLLDVFPR